MSDTPKRGRGKNKAFLLNRLQAMYGEDFHPIMKMAENANRAQELIEEYDDSEDKDPQALFAGLKFAVDAWDKIAQYTEPKLKAVEVSGEIKTRPLLVDLSGGELTKEFDSEPDETDN